MAVRTILLGMTAAVAALGAVPAVACDFDPVDIYFAPGRVSLTPDQREELVIQVMMLEGLGPGSRLRLTAYSDRVGSGSDNLALSRRRAQAVRDYLISKGAPADAIDILNRGEARPPVPTLDDRPEPRNRVVKVEALAASQVAKENPVPGCKGLSAN